MASHSVLLPQMNRSELSQDVITNSYSYSLAIHVKGWGIIQYYCNIAIMYCYNYRIA